MHHPMLHAALAVIASSVLGAVPAHAGTGAAAVELRGGFPVTSKAKIYPFAKVKRGDKGIGYTVFAEDKIGTFDVEILGVLENMLGPNRDVILARLHGPEIEYTGVISGMSGSPVYIDGMLLGAVSYRFGAFSKEPIAGITPIESMLEIYDSPEIEPPPSFTASVLFPSGNQGTRAVPGTPATRGITVADFRERGGLPAVALPKLTPVIGPYDPQPIETPISLVGLDPAVADELRAELHQAGFVTVAGSSRSGVAKRDDKNGRKVEPNAASMSGRVRAAPIAPGAPIAAVLVRGDMYVAATGTVTLVDGPEVLAFGHPFLGYGRVEYPMATAAILNTLATPLGSYKQGSTALEVGSITHDRLTTIAGKIGGVASMVPARIRVERSDVKGGEGTSKADVEIVKDSVWLPTMLDAVIASAAAGRIGYEAGGTVDLKVGISVGDRHLEFEDTYAADAPLRVSAYAARDIANTVSLITRNNLVPANITGIDVKLDVRREVALALLEQVIPDRTVVKPGEKLGLTARLRPFKRDPVSIRLSVDIPNDARGDVEVFVGGGIEMDRRDGDVYGERYPTDLDQLLGILAERRPARAIYARTYLSRPGLRSNAELFSSLPPSQRVALSMEPGRLTKAVSEAMGPVTGSPYKDVVIGGIAVPVTVVR